MTVFVSVRVFNTKLWHESFRFAEESLQELVGVEKQRGISSAGRKQTETIAGSTQDALKEALQLN